MNFLTFNLFNSENKVIDPCCGTGTFLEQVYNISSGNSLPKIIGFEILPGPYALAQYRMSMIVQEEDHDNFPQIILTNTLCDALEISDHNDVESSLLQQELDLAKGFSTIPITLIIGNPPSSDSISHSEGENFSIISDLLDDFRPPDEERNSRSNIQKQITNEFTKFLKVGQQIN